MHRRKFLKLVGVATAGAVIRVPFGSALAQAAAAKSVSSGGLLYKTDGKGRIFVSTTNGKSWTLHSNIGQAYSTALTTDAAGRLLATVGYLGRTFGLVLGSNRRSWLTT
jgi:hypothetical protein